MQANTPTCRLCGYSLKANLGCDVCSPVKAFLVWPVLTSPGSEQTAAEVISEALTMCRRRLRRLRTEENNEDGYNPHITRDLSTLLKTVRELASEQRKLEDREERDYAKLGFEGRCQLFVDEFFALLPEDFQVKLLMQMRECFENQNASMLPEPTSTDPDNE